LKSSIVLLRGIPTDCQELVAGTMVMRDQELLAAHCDGLGTQQLPLSVSLVISLDGPRELMLRNPTACNLGLKVALLEKLALTASSSNQNILGPILVTESLRDPQDCVREAAATALAQLSDGPDSKAFAAAHACLSEGGLVQAAAVSALGRMLKEEPGRACVVLCPLRAHQVCSCGSLAARGGCWGEAGNLGLVRVLARHKCVGEKSGRGGSVRGGKRSRMRAC